MTTTSDLVPAAVNSVPSLPPVPHTFNPELTLTGARMAADSMDRARTAPEFRAAAGEIARRFAALDAALSHGGRPPSDWPGCAAARGDRDILDWLSGRLDGSWSDPAGILEDLADKLRRTGRTAGGRAAA